MLPVFAKALCCLELFGCYCRRLLQRGVGEVLICCDITGRMLFSAFALAVGRFVTIGRRTAQFCFGLLIRCLFLDFPFLRPSRLPTYKQEGHFVTWQGLGNRSELKF